MGRSHKGLRLSWGTHEECRPYFYKNILQILFMLYLSVCSYALLWAKVSQQVSCCGLRIEPHTRIVFLLQMPVWSVGLGEGSCRDCDWGCSGKSSGPHLHWCLIECIHEMGKSSTSGKEFHTGQARCNSTNTNEIFNRGSAEVRVCKGYPVLWPMGLGWSLEDGPFISP